MTVLESGDTGLIDGKMVMGAPSVHVLLFIGDGRGRASSSCGMEGFRGGEARGGDAGRASGTCCGTAGALSRATRDFLIHEDVFDVSDCEGSCEGLNLESPRSDRLRLIKREDDFGLNGSYASLK